MESRLLFRTLMLSILSLISISANSQTDWQTGLLTDIVKVEKGNYFVEEYTLVKIDETNSIQLKTSARSPINIISRDKFVSMYSTYQVVILYALLYKNVTDFTGINMEKLDELIGQPDITLHFEMTRIGIQIQFTSEGETVNQTMTWDDIFKKK